MATPMAHADLIALQNRRGRISETHFKLVSIPEYTALRRDRQGERGGGVAYAAANSLDLFRRRSQVRSRVGDTVIGVV